ncbi:hypothetical protein ACTXT7_005920 [Hymenolepis weldensis]
MPTILHLEQASHDSICPDLTSQIPFRNLIPDFANLTEHLKKNHFKSEGGNHKKCKDQRPLDWVQEKTLCTKDEGRSVGQTSADMLSEPPPPPINSETLPTISVTRMRPRRMCAFLCNDTEVFDSESQHILSDEVNTSGTFVGSSGGNSEEEGEGVEESRLSDLRGTYEIRRSNIKRLQHEIQSLPEKPDSTEAALPQFLLRCSCESEEDGLTCNSADFSMVDSKENSSSVNLSSKKRRQWFKGTRIRLRRLLLRCSKAEDE